MIENSTPEIQEKDSSFSLGKWIDEHEEEISAAMWGIALALSACLLYDHIKSIYASKQLNVPHIPAKEPIKAAKVIESIEAIESTSEAISTVSRTYTKPTDPVIFNARPRKLPTGQKASPAAIERARNAGIILDDNHTFVREYKKYAQAS